MSSLVNYDEPPDSPLVLLGTSFSMMRMARSRNNKSPWLNYGTMVFRSNSTNQRLLYTKKLFSHGILHSQGNSIVDRMLAIHHMHNSVELFLKIIATEEGLIPRQKNWTFDRLWDAVSEALLDNKQIKLEYKIQMNNLNDSRNLIQHDGNVPSIEDCIKYRGYVLDFFEKYFLEYFGIPYDQFHSTSIIQDPELSETLSKAEQFLDDKQYKESIAYCAITFYNIKNKFFKAYRSGEGIVKDNIGKPLFFSTDEEKVPAIASFIMKLQEEFYILAMGLNYKMYKKFERIAPTIYYLYPELAEDIVKKINDEISNEEYARFCFEFVYECAQMYDSFKALPSVLDGRQATLDELK